MGVDEGRRRWIAISWRPHASGDREAYADLIRARGDRLFAIAQRILRDVDRTEDAVQDALVIAWRDLPGLRDPDRFDAWLLPRPCPLLHRRGERARRLIVNLSDPSRRAPGRYGRLRQRGRSRPAGAGLPSAATGAARHPRPAPLRRARTGGDRRALGIPPGTVRSRLHHAHRAMRAALEADARAIAIGGPSA